MVIQYIRASCFRLSTKPNGRGSEDVSIWFDPFSKEAGLRPPTNAADLVLVSTNNPYHNNWETFRGEPQVFSSPGEYTFHGMSIVGTPAFCDSFEGSQHGKNTIFTIETEGVVLCHLGSLGHELSSKQLEAIGTVDVLFVPVGSEQLPLPRVLDTIRTIEPHIVIPMTYKQKGLRGTFRDLQEFCTDYGNCSPDGIPKFMFKDKDILEKNAEVVVLEVQ